MKFYQLQTISSYQIGSSSINLESYVDFLSKLSYSGAGICDFNSINAFPYLDKACSKFKLKPVYLTTINFKDNEIFKISLVILSEVGYLNLVKLINQHKDFYTFEDLENKTEGLACILKSEDNKMKDPIFLENSNKIFLKLSHLFYNFYFGIEIYSNNELIEIEKLRDFIYKHSYNSLAFPKVIYLDKKDGFKAFKFLHAIINKENLTEKDLENSGPYFVLTTNVLSKLYLEKEIENQDQLIKLIDFTFIKKRGSVIDFGPESKKTLHDLAYDSLVKKFNNKIPNNYLERMEYELKIIDKMNFNSYFLIVYDYVNHFRNSNDVKVGPGRGSAAGSLICYLLNIVRIDPLKYNLYFERFLNPLRQTMPDIDIDFASDKRNIVIKYLKDKYLDKRVSLIITYSSLKMKATLMRINKVFSDIPTKIIESISKSINKKEENNSFKEEAKVNFRFKKLINDPYYLEIVKKASLVLFYPIAESTHASGVILSNVMLDEVLPLSKNKATLTNKYDLINIVDYENTYLEEMGFLKFDILGLNNLTFIDLIEKKIISNNKTLLNYEENLEDKKTFDVLNNLLVVDIFQLESYGIINALKQIKPTNIYDISVLLALYRPGPIKNISTYANRKNKHEKYILITPLLNDILKETYGILVYQEQVLEIAKKLANFDGGKADLFRRAISKKDESKILALKDEFIKGCEANKLTHNQAESIFKMIEAFADYGFNKAHSIAYSYITYNLLYLKANYPTEFYSISIDNLALNEEKFKRLKNELTFFSLEICGPNINYSQKQTSSIGNKLYIGFNKLKGLSDSMVENLLKEREKGNYISLVNFLFRNSQYLDESSLISLIYCGALDEFKFSRKDLVKNIHEIFLSSSFSTSEETFILPIILKDDGKKDVEDFINEYKVLNGVLSFELSSLIDGKSKYPFLFVVFDNPLYLHDDQTQLTLLSEYGIEKVYLNKHINVSKGDIISLNKLKQKVYDEGEILINKERLKNV